ncbi:MULTISPECIES: hypothetical protein [Vibrio]|uniref:hypothetical protein n=1 Tax=Vibrio TaxID=662 RepID=UPI00036A1663|nr:MULTISPECIES: hypothetical protein [Vibrio]EKO3821482.1 hypothetical protein [Vibrio harveyi]
MHQQTRLSKRKEAEIERKRAIARKRIEIFNELKSFGLQPEDAPLVCVLPKSRHSQPTNHPLPPSNPRHSKWKLREEREQRWGKKAKHNPLLLDVIHGVHP